VQQEDLSKLGISTSLNIEGRLEILREVQNAAVVFLIDEYHLHPPSLLQNKQNGDELVRNAGVDLILSESHEAGVKAMSSTLVDPPGCPDFANHFVNRAGLVVEGAECKALFDQQESDTSHPRWAGITARTHPIDRVRSLFFIGAVFCARRQHKLAGNAILNAGSHHNDDIVDLIRSGLIDELVGEPASYVRIRATAYPSGQASPSTKP
jgi:hypothetical protein